jgi:phage terminase small subunit
VANKRANLSPKEAVFVREYLKDGNGTRAAIAAGYAAKSAAVSSSKLLKKAKVREELGALQGKLCDELEISAKRVLQGIAQLAFFDARKFYAEDGSLKRVQDLDEATCAALQGVDVQKLFKHYGKGSAEEIGTLTKIRFTDRGLNLERLGRYLKLFTDKLEVNNGDAIIQKLKEGRARVAELKKKKS